MSLRAAGRRRGLIGLLLLSFILCLLLGLALERQPGLPEPRGAVSTGLAVRAKQLWDQVRPGAAPAGAPRLTRVSEADLNAVLAQAAQIQGGRWRAQVRLEPGRLKLVAARPLAGGVLWGNLALEFDLAAPARGRLPALRSARLGDLPLPPAWVTALAERWLARQQWLPSLQALLPMVDGWSAARGQLGVAWRWEPQRAAAAAFALLGPGEQEALLAQHRELLQALADVPAWNGVSVQPLLMRMSRLALRRLDAPGAAEPAGELRALLLALGLQAMGRDLGEWLPAARAHGPLPPVLLLLAGREDMAMHFLLSSLISWQGGERLAQSLGLAKELSDERTGSGFSFNDLAADDAGNRFGQVCARAPLALLQRLAQGLPEAAFFPEVADLPEFLHEAAFQQRYGQVGSAAYEQELQKIRARVASLAIYQGFPGL